MTIWLKKKVFTKGPELWHVGFVSPEKHCSEVFFAGLLFEICINKTRYRINMSDRAHKVKADIEKNFGGKCWP